LIRILLLNVRGVLGDVIKAMLRACEDVTVVGESLDVTDIRRCWTALALMSWFAKSMTPRPLRCQWAVRAAPAGQGDRRSRRRTARSAMGAAAAAKRAG